MSKFKVGDKVVYIDEYVYLNSPLTKYKSYTISRFSTNSEDYFNLQESPSHCWYFIDCFVLLKEYRKQKLKKLNYGK